MGDEKDQGFGSPVDPAPMSGTLAPYLLAWGISLIELSSYVMYQLVEE